MSLTLSPDRCIVAAQKQLCAVEAELAHLASRVLTDLYVANRYTTLIRERGRLRMVIATEREALRR